MGEGEHADEAPRKKVKSKAKDRKNSYWSSIKSWTAAEVADTFLLGAEEGGFAGLEILEDPTILENLPLTAASGEDSDPSVLMVEGEEPAPKRRLTREALIVEHSGLNQEWSDEDVEGWTESTGDEEDDEDEDAEQEDSEPGSPIPQLPGDPATKLSATVKLAKAGAKARVLQTPSKSLDQGSPASAAARKAAAKGTQSTAGSPSVKVTLKRRINTITGSATANAAPQSSTVSMEEFAKLQLQLEEMRREKEEYQQKYEMEKQSKAAEVGRIAVLLKKHQNPASTAKAVKLVKFAASTLKKAVLDSRSHLIGCVAHERYVLHPVEQRFEDILKSVDALEKEFDRNDFPELVKYFGECTFGASAIVQGWADSIEPEAAAGAVDKSAAADKKNP